MDLRYGCCNVLYYKVLNDFYVIEKLELFLKKVVLLIIRVDIITASYYLDSLRKFRRNKK